MFGRHLAILLTMLWLAPGLSAQTAPLAPDHLPQPDVTAEALTRLEEAWRLFHLQSRRLAEARYLAEERRVAEARRLAEERRRMVEERLLEELQLLRQRECCARRPEPVQAGLEELRRRLRATVAPAAGALVMNGAGVLLAIEIEAADRGSAGVSPGYRVSHGGLVNFVTHPTEARLVVNVPNRLDPIRFPIEPGRRYLLSRSEPPAGDQPQPLTLTIETIE